MFGTGKLAWGILGLGPMARRFAADLPASRTGMLAAVASRDAEKARAFGSEFGASRVYGSYDELLADDAVDAVYIATPHAAHARWAVRAAQVGKHVLCEKPLALNHAEAMAVVEAAREHDIFLMEAFMYRCHPQTTKLVELLRAGTIGEVHQIEASLAFRSKPRPGSRLFDPALGGGAILDLGCYTVSMARLIAGCVAGLSFFDPLQLTATGHVSAETGIDDWALATLHFPQELTAHIATGLRLSTDNVVRVFGKEGYLVVPNPWLPGRDGTASTIQLHRLGAEMDEIVVESVPLYAAEADAVAAHLDSREVPAVSWDDTLGNMATLDRWRAAIGLTYPSERPDAELPTVHGRPLTRRGSHTMRYGEISALETPVSRLVMGAAELRTLSHTSVMFDDFVERGGNCFDTAYVYGRGISERLLGQWLRNRSIRDEVVVIGKGAHTPHCDPESIPRQLAESLDRLQTDHVDLYFMHRDNLDVPVGEFVDVLNELRRAGLIRAYGGSNWTADRFTAANEYAEANRRFPFVALSNNFSLARAVDVPWPGCASSSDDKSRAWLEKANLVLMPWSSQARGFFAGRAAPDNQSDPVMARCWYSDDNFERLARARKLAAQRGVAATAVALAYVLHQDFPTFPLIGPRTIAETRSSFEALRVELTQNEVRWLDLRASS